MVNEKKEKKKEKKIFKFTKTKADTPLKDPPIPFVVNIGTNPAKGALDLCLSMFPSKDADSY